MKKLAIILTIVAATAMIFSSCGKYEEGPSVSLLTKKARITGTWTHVETTINGTAYPSEYSISTTLEKDGTGAIAGSMGGITMSVDIEWEFNDSKESIRIREKDADSSTGWDEWSESKIIRLTNKECWLQDTEIENGISIITISKMEKE
ncbi:MAG: hypothetical protein PHW82_05385 [Bacteroidales bacterium]|nr:hypothetical protein [Bacteroidales bacterium]